MTRRDLLVGMIGLVPLLPGAGWRAGSAGAVSADRRLAGPAATRSRQTAAAGDRFLSRVSMTGPRPIPLNRLIAADLDARLFTDLSNLTPRTLLTPNEQFYVRTACPAAARDPRGWSIAIRGLVRSPRDVTVDALMPGSRPQGTCLLECAGNGDPDNYGLMSAAEWQGVPARGLFELARPAAGARRVLVSGMDGTESRMGTSIPGASWIFDLDQLDRAGAFFATHMNGQPLSPHHGAPIRLVVPGWYGCACIKWVNEIRFVEDEAPATTQMQEFAARTHQIGVPALARGYAPATIDHAAMPVRVERWLRDGRSIYRVVGIQWGGARPIDKWLIRFRADLPFEPVDECARPASTTTWSLWSHEWRPPEPGRYEIVLRPADPAIRARRMEMAFYRRTLVIDEA